MDESSDDADTVLDALKRERRYDEKQRRLEEEQRLVDKALCTQTAAAERRSVPKSLQLNYVTVTT